MDFYRIEREDKKDAIHLSPDFTVGRTKDLMVRGQGFYAIWDEEAQKWSTDEYDAARLVDAELMAEAKRIESDIPVSVKTMASSKAMSWRRFKMFMRDIADNYHTLDSELTFASQKVTRSDYRSRRLPYDLEHEGDCSNWDELIGILYDPDERRKIEWAIGAVLSGDSKYIQKFMVLYGSAGTGKSTILNIIEKLFSGYTAYIDAKALGASGAQFAMDVFRNNPLVAIQHDGDLSVIQDNTRINSIVSHERMTINEKYKSAYETRVNAFLFVGTNMPVKISDAKSGLIRRLIDVTPTGNKIPIRRYNELMGHINHELGAIAAHCLDVYRKMGMSAYDAYRPVDMMFQTDPFFNFIESNYDVFKTQDGVSLKQAYDMYKDYCVNSGAKPRQMHQIREELKQYFKEFHPRYESPDGERFRSYFKGFHFNIDHGPVQGEVVEAPALVLDDEVSLLDVLLGGYPAQLANSDGFPKKRWASVETTLSDLDTHKVHFVQVPIEHIVIDFDLRGPEGEKSLELNLQEAAKWPLTYAELSKSGSGVHLHYIYEGDPEELANEFSPGIEIKVYKGNSSLRRKLTKCNALPVNKAPSGLPKKEKRDMLQGTVMQSEKSLRDLISRNLRKEIHPGTKPSVDFIKKVLDDAYESGMPYNVIDLRPKIVAFANNSSHQSMACLKTVQQMRWQSEEEVDPDLKKATDDRLVFFDVEVYSNLFVVCWKYKDDPNVVRMINPSSQDIEGLLGYKLVGFNNRRYDNHILWARYMGYSNEALYALSQKLIDNQRAGTFGEAYGVSYTDIYDFSSIKQGLKKFEIQLGLKHVEMDIPWDQPVPDDMVEKVVEYCVNDVVATEAVFNDRASDFAARQILAELSGLTVNDTTAKHTARIIFGDDKNPQASFVYTDLSKEFPGYTFDLGKSTYRDEEIGEGGYVYAEPGMYSDVLLLDVASMHPTSMERLNMFGPYTKNYTALKQARLAIKHGDYDKARGMLGGKLAPYLGDAKDADRLSYALKIVINIVYGLTSAKFDNPFRDVRNVDNIAAKRGALFMVDLKHAVQEKGWTVAHIKTDSIKIPDMTPEMIDFVVEFGAKYGYDFELEGVYEKFCLVNDAVYIAKKGDKWDAVGAQFAHPYVYKTLFTHEPLEWDDYCETKQVTKGAIYIDFDAVHKAGFAYEGMHFVGRTGRFVPVSADSGGGILYRVHDGKNYAVTGSKGYLWMEADMAKSLGEDVDLDISYYEALVDAAQAQLEKYGDSEAFIS